MGVLRFEVLGCGGTGIWQWGKLAVYRRLKDLPAAEPYARTNLPVSIRRVLARVRAGCLPLQVELGIYSSPKTPFTINERLCKMHTTWRLTIKNIVPVSESGPQAALWAEISKHNPDFISYDNTAKLAYLLHPTELIFIKGIHKLYVHRYTLLYHSHWYFLISHISSPFIFLVVTVVLLLLLFFVVCWFLFVSFFWLYTLSCHPCLTIAPYM